MENTHNAEESNPQKMEVLPAPSADYVAKAEAKSLEFMNPKRWQVMEYMAKTFMMSGALPKSIDTAPKMIMAFQAGYEAGLQPLESLNSFYFVNGKLSMYGDTVIAQILKAGHEVIWGDCNAETATVTIKRGDTGKKMSATFTMAMAIQRGLTKDKFGDKEVWKKFPDNMLKFKAVGMIAKFIVPDALHGIAIKEDLEGSQLDALPEKKAEENKPADSAPKISHRSLEEALQESDEPEGTPKDEKESKPKKIKKVEAVSEELAKPE